jgi:hypothetical protein
MNKTDKQIQDLLKDRCDVEVSHQNIRDTYRHGKKWMKVISYFKNKYLKNISRIPIANKAHRLALLNEASEEALTWHTKSINEFGEVLEKKIGILPALIAEARKEVEGEKPQVEQHFHVSLSRVHDLVNGNAFAEKRSSLIEPLNAKNTDGDNGNGNGNGNGHKNRIELV